MKIYCLEHGRELGEVERNPVRGSRQMVFRSARWRDRYAVMAGIEGRYNANVHLDDRAVSTVETDACDRCGSRQLPIRELVAAFEARLPYIAV